MCRQVLLEAEGFIEWAWAKLRGYLCIIVHFLSHTKD